MTGRGEERRRKEGGKVREWKNKEKGGDRRRERGEGGREERNAVSGNALGRQTGCSPALPPTCLCRCNFLTRPLRQCADGLTVLVEATLNGEIIKENNILPGSPGMPVLVAQSMPRGSPAAMAGSGWRGNLAPPPALDELPANGQHQCASQVSMPFADF